MTQKPYISLVRNGEGVYDATFSYSGDFVPPAPITETKFMPFPRQKSVMPLHLRKESQP